MKQKNLLRYFLVFLVFAAVFAVVFFMQRSSLEQQFVAATQKVPSIRNFGTGTVEDIQRLAPAYGALAGVALGFVAFIVSAIVLILLKLIRLAKFNLSHLLLLLLIYGAYLALAIELRYFEKAYSAISLGIIYFVGYPLLSASIAASVSALIIYSILMVKKKPLDAPAGETAANASSLKKSTLMLLLAISPFMLSGCSFLAGMQMFACDFMPDSPHCFQNAALDKGDPDDCEKVQQPEKFKNMGSNPPKDKCYLMIAQNTGDLEACKKIQGGLMSYTQDECYADVASSKNDPDICKDSPDELACRSQAAKKEPHDCGTGFVWDSQASTCVKIKSGKNTLAPGEKVKIKIKNIEGKVYIRKSDNTLFQVTEESEIGVNDLNLVSAEDTWATMVINGKEYQLQPDTNLLLNESLDTMEASLVPTSVR